MTDDPRRRRRRTRRQPHPAPATDLLPDTALLQRIADTLINPTRPRATTSSDAEHGADHSADPDALIVDGKQIGTVRALHRSRLLQTDRVELASGATLFWKRLTGPLRAETGTLTVLASTEGPVTRVGSGQRPGDTAAFAVPAVLATVHESLTDGLLLQDLGPAPLPLPSDAWPSTVRAIHTTPAPAWLPTIDGAHLASLPARALAHLDALRADGVGRWPDSDRIAADLAYLRSLGQHRSSGATTAPYGLCHSRLDHSALFATADGTVYVLGWAWASRGPGLLDLLGSLPLGADGNYDAFDAHDEVLDAYLAAGGDPAAERDRGGLPATRWAAGWHRVVQAERLLHIVATWLDHPDDAEHQREVAALLHEAVQCLR
ncbi:hypothetical protein AB0M46_21540 [Dactylosporangium sp. NPDC051485]|uniref:hypothetical protein n=1 Tax=Dactylosporangium sp. NPDC051485 TaxID=3154846 RepID=UPI0034138ED7